MLRRNFLRAIAPGLAVAAVPAVAVGAAIASQGEAVPMRGKSVYGHWSAITVNTCGALDETEFVSHSMRERPDGLYDLVWERDQ